MPVISSVLESSLSAQQVSRDTFPTEPVENRFEVSFPAMGTLIAIVTYTSNREVAESAFSMARQRVQAIENTLTDYDPESETRRLTDIAAHGPVVVSNDLWNVLMACDRWYQLSNGKFDASLGQVTQLWRKHRRAGRLPAPEQVAAALEQTGWSNIRFDRDKHLVEFLKSGIRLDFGAIGKGYAVDAVFDVLQQHDLSQSLVNMSGNIRCGRSPPGAKYWTIEIAAPKSGQTPVRHIGIQHCAVATSGDLWQFTVVNGVRRSHIIDPRAGYGVPGPLSVTAFTDGSAADADALATAACILPDDEAIALAESLEGAACLIVRPAENEDETGSEFRILESASFPVSLD